MKLLGSKEAVEHFFYLFKLEIKHENMNAAMKILYIPFVGVSIKQLKF